MSARLKGLTVGVAGALSTKDDAGAVVLWLCHWHFFHWALEQATYEMIPVIYITGNTHPDHNSINTFRKRFLGELKGLSCRFCCGPMRWGCCSWAM